MKACLLDTPAPVESRPLRMAEVPKPEPDGRTLLIRVHACGICRTDLHVVEGELEQHKSPVTPGHQVVGTVELAGPDAQRFHPGDRVGVPWLHRTCGVCEYCRSGRENLCDSPIFTGWTADGGYAEYIVAEEDFVYPLPEGFAAGGRLGMYGFGAAAHVAIQVARYWGIDVYAFTRDRRHRELAADLGAVWSGGSSDQPPVKLDAALIFAPAGELIPASLRSLKKGGTVALGGIHMSPIPSFDYDLIYGERVLRSVANNTRQDGADFLSIAAAIPIHTEIQEFPLEEANQALVALKNDGVRGAAVLSVQPEPRP